jgi:hypothetical protein
MKSILLAAAAIACLAAPASAQGAKSAVEEAISGTWKCSTSASGVSGTSSTVYLAGGKETFDMTANVAAANMEFTASGTGDWKLQPDGKLVETITGLTVKTAKVNGAEAPAAALQDMLASSIVGQTSTSTIQLKDGGMITTDQNGTVSTCKR